MVKNELPHAMAVCPLCKTEIILKKDILVVARDDLATSCPLYIFILQEHIKYAGKHVSNVACVAAICLPICIHKIQIYHEP